MKMLFFGDTSPLVHSDRSKQQNSRALTDFTQRIQKPLGESEFGCLVTVIN